MSNLLEETREKRALLLGPRSKIPFLVSQCLTASLLKRDLIISDTENIFTFPNPQMPSTQTAKTHFFFCKAYKQQVNDEIARTIIKISHCSWARRISESIHPAMVELVLKEKAEQIKLLFFSTFLLTVIKNATIQSGLQGIALYEKKAG